MECIMLAFGALSVVLYALPQVLESKATFTNVMLAAAVLVLTLCLQLGIEVPHRGNVTVCAQ